MARYSWVVVGVLIAGGLALAETPAGPVPPASPAEPLTYENTGILNGCCTQGNCCDDGCCPQSSIEADYLLWWVKGGPVPPLVTTGTVGSQGVLGDRGTDLLFGNSDLNYNAFSGIRVMANTPLGSASGLGLQVGGFVLEQGADGFSANTGSGFPVIARPVINGRLNQETVSLVDLPGAFTGGVAVSSTSQLWGLEANVTSGLSQGCGFHGGWLAGVRYLQLEEDLGVEQNVRVLQDGIAGFAGQVLTRGEALSIQDHFGARNRFIGGQLGAQAGYQWGRMGVDVIGKIALGYTKQSVDIQGLTARVNTGAVANGGVLALPSNSGSNNRDAFGFVPEVGVQLSYAITPRLQARVGYSFLYWSDVARGGDQVERRINPNQVPSSIEFGRVGGAAEPFPAVHSSDFWAQGLNFGLAFTY